MTRDEIIVKVKQKLGEVTTFDVGEIADDTLIDSLLDPGVRDVLLKAPLHLINGYDLPAPSSGSNGSLVIEVDSDYLKLHSLKLHSNEKEFNEFDVIKPGDPKYKYINYPSTRGTISKPKIYFKSGGRPQLIIYCDGGSYEYGYYVKEVLAESLQPNLIEPLAWKVAGDVLLVLGDEAAANCYAKEEEFFKIS